MERDRGTGLFVGRSGENIFEGTTKAEQEASMMAFGMSYEEAMEWKDTDPEKRTFDYTQSEMYRLITALEDADTTGKLS